MAEPEELPLWIQVFLKAYPYRRARWGAPAAVMPLRESKVVLVTTAGLHLSGQPPFNISMKGGDCSYRWIPNSTAVQQLRVAHRSKEFNQEGVEQDRNLCFPLDRFRELVEEGIVGSMNERHLSFMGSITAPGRLIHETAPEAAKALKEEGVDLAFLVPV